jgi:hypothetical protein
MAYMITTTATIRIEIPDGFTESQFEEFVSDRIVNLSSLTSMISNNSISLDEEEYCFDETQYKFKCEDEFDPTQPVWIDVSGRGIYSASSVLIIKQGFVLPDDLEMPTPWIQSQNNKTVVKNLAGLIPSTVKGLTPHNGRFQPWTYPLMKLGLKAFTEKDNKSIAWLTNKDGEIVAGVMPCDVLHPDRSNTKLWPI